jgi:hypothetical protein
MAATGEAAQAGTVTASSGRHATGLLLVGAILAGCLLGCAPRPNGEARARVKLMARDSIRELSPPGGHLRGEAADPGHETQAPFGQAPPTLRRSYAYTGTARAAAKVIREQLRAHGWVLYPSTCYQADDVRVRAGKDIGGFDAGFSARVIDRPAEPGDPSRGLPPVQPRKDIHVEISTPYPDEQALDAEVTRPPRKSPPPAADCLED